MKQMSEKFINRLLDDKKPVMIFDGAMGTSIQELELTADDFGGNKLEGCNENLVLTKPNIVKQIHRQFLEAGCDVIETNTFGASSVVLDEYNISEKVFEINKQAGLLAREAIKEFDTFNKPRYVAGSMGPTTKLPTLGHIDFDALKESYLRQAEGLIAGNIDLFLIETCQDILQIKAALQAIQESQNIQDHKIPIMVSVTMETNGKMLVGTDIQTVVNILQPFDIDILGINCATGPEQMKDHIKYLSENSPFIISCIPNAGLPENIGGVAHYKLSPTQLKMELLHFVSDLGVRIIGGCCGTTPEHIKQLYNLSSDIKSNSNYKLNRLKNEKYILKNLCSSSIYSSTPYIQENSFLIIGERLNASGSKKVRDLLNNNDWDGLIGIARSQLKENAHVLDVNVDYVGRDGQQDMKEIVSRLVNNINLPLMLDSTEWEKMESGLKQAGGKCILNSTNYEDGEERFYKVVDLAKNYGAGIVIGTIDETGMARTAEKKYSIADRAYKALVDYGISPGDIFFDPLALPISTGIEEDRLNGSETINSIKLIKENLKGSHIILGVSNISFGLNPAARINLNSVFLNDCYLAGLDSAIVSPSKILPLSKITKEHKKICRDLINDNREYNDNICIYDPLTELTKVFEGITTKDARENKELFDSLSIEDKLKQHIIEGERTNLNLTLDESLKKYEPLEIINSYLLSGMKTVGELFGSGQMQLPFVLQSAETMKAAVSYLEDFMDKSTENRKKAKVIIATVKGDVHDIGKNLVDIILTNNGYDVINLGIKQEVNSIIEAQTKYKADCIAMSGLLVKSTAFMKDNLLAFNKADIKVPVILGGAALTPSFVNKDCSYIYKGKLLYGKDAFTDLRFMEAYCNAKKNKQWSDEKGFLNNEEAVTLGADYQGEIIIKNQKNTINNNKSNTDKSLKEDNNRSTIVDKEPSIKPPFIGYRILNKQSLDIMEIYKFLDKNALYSGQWQLKKTRGQSLEEYKHFIKNKAEPILEKWIEKIIAEDLLDPSISYGYFNCASSGNQLLIFDDKGCNIIERFNFPRQRSGKRLCIADFFNEISSEKSTDIIPMQAVTMGETASKYSQQLFKENNYTDYLYFHGLAVQMAEALAEWTHSLIRIECGFKDNEPQKVSDILSQKYRGCRYSFGYPACPKVSDSAIQLKLLEAKDINLTMDSSDQLHPEQSTTAVVALHSQARHFSA